MTGPVLNLLAWVLVSATASVDAVGQAVQVSTFAAVLALPMGLGVPFVIANYLRTDDGVLAPLARVWPMVRAVVAASAAFGVVGIAICFTAASPASLQVVLGLSLANGSVVCLATVVQSLGRIARLPAYLFLGSASSVYFPASLAACLIAASSWTLNLVYCVLGLLLALACVLVRLIVRVSRSCDEPVESPALRSVLATAVPLVPHLLAYGSLMQGMRLVAIASESVELITGVHYLMLIVNAGLAVVAGVHSFISVKLQLQTDVIFSARAARVSALYGLLGLFASGVVVAIAASPISALFMQFPGLSLKIVFGVFVLIVSVCIHYFLSACCVRSGSSVLLPFSSLATLVILWAALPLFSPSSIDEITLYFSATVALLPVLLSVLIAMCRRNLWPMVRWSALASCLVSLVAGVGLVF